MTFGVFTFEIHLPMAESLKDRRQVVRRLKDRLRGKHNVAVGEESDHSELWQRASLVVVSVAQGRDALERLFEAIYREAEALVPGTVFETGRDFLDAVESGFGESEAEEDQ